MRFSPHRRLLVALVMATISAPALAAPSPALASARQPAARYSRLAPARIVDLKSLPPSPRSAGGTVVPFRPRSPGAFAAAKRAAAASRVGRRGGVVTASTPGSPRAAAPRAAQQGATASGLALQVGPSFPTVSMDQQVSWFNPNNDQLVTPPDTQLAPGPSSLVEMTNSSLSIWSKSGVLQAGQRDLYAFYNNINPATTGLSDPRVVYDGASGRWFASAFSFSLTANASSVWVAVSQSADPAGSWAIFDVSDNPALIQDQPKFDLTADKMVISWNDFNGTTNPFVGEETLVIEKADLLNPATRPRMAALMASPDPARYNLIPVQSEDGSATVYLVGNGNSDGAGAFARLLAVTGTPAAANVSWAEEDVAIAPTNPPPGAMQGAGTPLLATNDDAFLSAAVRNGILWIAGNDACVPSGTAALACSRLIQVSIPGRPAVIQDVDLTQGSGTYNYFPAVAIDTYGNLVAVYTASTESSYAAVGVSGQAAGAPGTFVSGLNIQGGGGAYSCGPSCVGTLNGERWGDYSSAQPDPSSPGTIWVGGEYGTQPAPAPTPSPTGSPAPTPTPSNTSNNWGTAAGQVTFTPSTTLKTAVSWQQYQLPNSDGRTWVAMDPNQLSITVTPSANGPAIIGANLDLWTANAGYNQDIGIDVSPAPATGTYPDNIVAWKESGGFAGTNSPNAAYVQGVVDLLANTTYTVTLNWKANKPAAGATIYAGAGNGPAFSPTRMTLQLSDLARTQTAVSTDQAYLTGNNGGDADWVPVAAGVHLTVPPVVTGTMRALVSGNADLWTKNAGYNQDLGIQVTSNGVTSIAAWKESGGRAGTFSPNAAFVQTVLDASTVTNGFDVSLVWKSNKPEGAATIVAGAGPSGPFSPTRLTVRLVSGDRIATFASTDQYTLVNSDGQNWSQLGTTFPDLTNAGAPAWCLAIISVNVDLWTATAGVNQDVAIEVRNGSADPFRAVVWKESGGLAGTFSPNAAYLETVVGVQSGHSLDVRVGWKSNFPTGGRIYAGAGTGPYSPTRLTLQWVCS